VLAGIGCREVDLGIAGERIAAVAQDLSGATAAERIDARGLTVLPGAIDAHYHLGIYRGLAEDAESETLSSLAGGVTSVLSYFRTGDHYLHRTGPYSEILPEVLAAVAGHARTDYGFHLAPMDSVHLGEIPQLIERHGVGSFKYYMFYKGLDLSGVRPAHAETMSETYDLGHLFEILEQVAAAAQRGSALRLSVSIHAEQPELIRVFMQRVRAHPTLRGLHAYSEARPPLTERLAIGEAGVLAAATRCPVNLLHLSSAEALDAAVELRRSRPQLDVRLETTLHHLALSMRPTTISAAR